MASLNWENTLELMMNDQAKLFTELNGGLDPKNLTSEQKQALFNKFILALHEETTELLKTTSYKSHDKRPRQYKRSNTVIEIVDVFKYLMNICVIMGVDAEELFKYEREKTIAVRQRYAQQQIDFTDQKVILVDIDGVLADYPQSFFNFVNGKLGTNHDPVTQNDYDLAKAMNLDRKTYEDLKYEYRESGYKRNIPVLPGAKEGMAALQQMGFKIVIFTARPVSEYNRIELDTLYWLKNNGFKFDMLLFAEKKNEELAKFYKNVVPVCFLEDSESNAAALSNDGIKVVLFNKPYHHGKKYDDQMVVRVDAWSDALKQVEKWT